MRRLGRADNLCNRGDVACCGRVSDCSFINFQEASNTAQDSGKQSLGYGIHFPLSTFHLPHAPSSPPRAPLPARLPIPASLSTWQRNLLSRPAFPLASGGPATIFQTPPGHGTGPILTRSLLLRSPVDRQPDSAPWTLKICAPTQLYCSGLAGLGTSPVLPLSVDLTAWMNLEASRGESPSQTRNRLRKGPTSENQPPPYPHKP